MSSHDSSLDPGLLNRLSESAGAMGYEIVDIAGFFDQIERRAREQSEAVGQLRSHAGTVNTATEKVLQSSETLSNTARETARAMDESASRVRETSANARDMASWVQDLSDRTATVSETLSAVKTNNQDIVGIARQVNTLAINAKIEAARAGDAGRGFSVVADAINSLSQQTGTAAVQISENVDILGRWILTLAEETQEISTKAAEILERSSKNDTVLTELEQSMKASRERAGQIMEEARRMRSSLDQFTPCLQMIGHAVTATTDGIKQANKRINNLIDTSETVVQGVAALGGVGKDARFIEFVQHAAARISAVFDAALKDGEIAPDALFDRRYVPIEGTNPEQVRTRFTDFTDRVLPAIQEGALELDRRVVFCAAVDQNGYLPTHNLKFSQPQGQDPVWNTANCRNRRIFDDRVGLKAGRNKQPFLLQVYRRDMGGGDFAMMKDISSPIVADGRHWGGLRLAVKF